MITMAKFEGNLMELRFVSTEGFSALQTESIIVSNRGALAEGDTWWWEPSKNNRGCHTATKEDFGRAVAALLDGPEALMKLIGADREEP